MGERSGKILLGLVLLVIGGLVLLDQLGIDSGAIISLLIAGAIMVYGVRKFVGSSGSRFWGVAVFLFGFLMLIGKLELLFTSLLAIGIICLGYRLIRSRDRSREAPPEWERQWARRVIREADYLDRWEERVSKNKQ
jgi:lia operon protein LiaI